MRFSWLGRLLAMVGGLLGWRRRPPFALERHIAPTGLEVAVLRVRRGPRSLDELAARVALIDWAAKKPGRELVLVRRSSLRGSAAVE